MFTSFSTALSALGAHSAAIDVVGHNLANLNTPGFKASVVSFYDVVGQSMGAGLNQTENGFGVGRPQAVRQFSQGAIQASNAPFDTAIQGDGFLVFRDAGGATLYGRGGSLQVNKEGVLMTATGERVQGWSAVNGVLNPSGIPGDLVIPVGTLRPAQPTRTFTLDGNLSAAGTAGPPATTFKHSLEVFDSLGAPHLLTVNFTKTATPGEWSYALSVPDGDVSAPLTPVTGTIGFDSAGRLVSPPPGGTPVSISIKGLKNGAADLEVSWGLYDGTTPRLTQFAQKSEMTLVSQDGSPVVELTKVGLGEGGQILAQFSNGQQVQVGQLAMASVRNPESLVSVGNNSYRLSSRTALPVVGLPGTGGRGMVQGGAIENSTVDIAREFTNLIVLQRGYQANSRVVTTVDELSQETINLKR